MRTRKLTIALGLAVASLAACGGDRLLVGTGPTGAGGSSSPAGAAGMAAAGTTGVAGASATGAAGTTATGTAGTGAAGSVGTGAGGSFSSGFGGAAGTTAGATGSAGAGPTPLPISSLEATARVAEVLWQQAQVDGPILALAQSGEISTVEQLTGAVRQMLADPRAGAGVGAFYVWWLGLEEIAAVVKDPTLFPAYTPTLQHDMLNETVSYGTYVTLNLKGTYGLLMTSPFSLLDGLLADLYGVSGVTGTTLTEVALDPSQRAGLLTQAAPLVLTSFASRNSPSNRGKYILERFLCRTIPPPPAGLPTVDMNLAPGVTVREALAETLAGSATCAACHNQMDPQGLEFENYDPIGRWRTIDNGAPVDLSGLSVLDFDTGDEVTIAGPIAYASYLAGNTTARSCFAQQWLAFALGQTDFTSVTSAQVAPLFQKFTDSGFDLQELIIDVLTSDTFLAPS
jgi:hypothetical protein